jgi:hypothetical protein
MNVGNYIQRRESLGSARVARAGERVLGIANFFLIPKTSVVATHRKSSFRWDAETSTRNACAQQT